jgi:hypothetical protein
MKCNICGEDIEVEDSGWSRGNNARPVNKGRCCNKCNLEVVVPVRIKRAMESKS